MRFQDHPRSGRAACALALIVAVGAMTLMLAGCKGSDGPILEESKPVSAPTVQAPIPGDTSTPAAEASQPVGATTGSNIWPDKVGKFAKGVQFPVWWPAVFPQGFKIETLDVVELDPGTGLICDTVWLSGTKALLYTQGSPKERSYEVSSVEKVAWGNETADLVHQDPADPASPVIIVYNKGGNFAELQGDLTADQLKAIAASMVLVK